MSIKNNYQYIKLLLGVAVISVTLFASGCNTEWLYNDGIIEEPAAKNGEYLEYSGSLPQPQNTGVIEEPATENAEPLSKPKSCRKTRGFGVHGHKKEENECQ